MANYFKQRTKRIAKKRGNEIVNLIPHKGIRRGVWDIYDIKMGSRVMHNAKKHQK